MSFLFESKLVLIIVADNELSVNHMIFLKKENFLSKQAAHLVSTGPWGMIHFWSIFGQTEIRARFFPPVIFSS
jgi:hypothetical protein